MRKGFTLIELMIVIAIIAIIAAIAIPNLLSGRMSANEVSAMGTLKQFTSTEAIWLQQGPDGNGMKDYWTYDISCLHRLYRADGSTKVAFVPLDVARADVAPAAETGDTFGTTLPYEIWTGQGPSGAVDIQPKSGFWFHVMLKTNLTAPPSGDFAAEPYCRNLVGDSGKYGCNHNAYAFMATPDAYGASGIRSFIVNEAGTIYSTDTGANNERGSGYGTNGEVVRGIPGDGQDNAGPTGYKKWQTSADPLDVCAWPTRNPAQIPSASGKYWEVAE